jgi:hypothetical protein
MSGRDVTNAYLRGEVDRLEPFAFVAMSPAGRPLHMVEATRREDQGLEVRVPGRPPSAPELPASVRAVLLERGFASEDPADPKIPWVREAPDSDTVVEILWSLLDEVFEEKPDIAVDVLHGSHKAEHDARLKLTEVRERVERVIGKMLDGGVEQDADGDYLLAIGDVQVVVAPRALPGGPALVRVFAVTNVGVVVTPELGLFLARLNFGLTFGRFALDAEHNAIWFDETLLGDPLNEEALRFTIDVVARTADEWDDRLKQMFGGAKHQEVLKERGRREEPPSKPGQGSGLYL